MFFDRRTAKLSLLSSLLLVVPLLNCSTSSSNQSSGDRSGAQSSTDRPLFGIPNTWSLVGEQQDETLYQANLQNEEGPGRILIGRLKLEDNIRDLGVYLNQLHDSLVDRIRGQADVAPFAEDQLSWTNGLIGYRTKMRGEIRNSAVVIEGITFSDGDHAYFNYGLFPEEIYDQERSVYEEILSSFRPLRGAEIERDRGLNVERDKVAEKEDAAGSDSAESPEDYKSPKTHLGVVEWGTSREEILEAEGEPLREGKNALGYRCQFLGLEDCVVIYLFTFDELTHGGFLLESDHDDPQKFVSKYLRLTKDLTDNYGKPTQSAAIWQNPKYRDDGKMWGRALSENHVIFGTVWQVGPTKIVHSLRKNDDGEIDHRILMTNEKLRKELQQRVQSKR